MPTVLIGADLCPIEGNRPYFISGDARSLFNDLLAEMQEADLVIANLECALIEKETPIAKTGPVFGEPAACIRGIREAGIDVLCLANNHILDHGAAGLQHTLAVCAEAGIATVGAAENLAQARRILVRETGGVRVGILAMAEHEFSIAGKASWGANPLDPIDFVRNVRSHRDCFDYLIVLFHGGDEFHVPSPATRNLCRFLVEMGANAVIVQHPHRLGGYEHYENGHIVYGQGAWIMDEAIYRDRRSFHEGYLVKLVIADDFTSRMEVIPLTQSAPVPGARRMPPDQASRLQEALDSASQIVRDDRLVEAEWIRFCQRRKHAYLSGLLGYNRVLRKLNARGHLLRWFYSTRTLLGVRNLVCCETHREALQTILDSEVRQKN